MPYSIEHRPVKSGKDFAIVRKTDGHIVGRFETKAKAEASARARMAGEHKR